MSWPSGKGYFLLAEGCTRYGTEAAAYYLTHKLEELTGKSLVIIHWMDLDGSRSVTEGDLIEIVYSR